MRDQTLNWEWSGSETEWKAATLAYIGNPIARPLLNKSVERTGRGILSFLYRGIEKLTRPKKA